MGRHARPDEIYCHHRLIKFNNLIIKLSCLINFIGLTSSIATKCLLWSCRKCDVGPIPGVVVVAIMLASVAEMAGAGASPVEFREQLICVLGHHSWRGLCDGATPVVPQLLLTIEPKECEDVEEEQGSKAYLGGVCVLFFSRHH